MAVFACTSIRQSSIESGDVPSPSFTMWVRAWRVRGMKPTGAAALKVPWRGVVEVEEAESGKT